MAKRVGRLACVSLSLLLCGCAGMFGRQGLPPDPLFANRKPIETTAVSGPPVPVPFSAPAAPSNAYAAER